MSSLAASSFYLTLQDKGEHFIALSNDERLRPISETEKQNTLHASLAVSVAAWDAYVKALVREFYTTTARPLDPIYSQVHSIAIGNLNNSLTRFNTPNAENCQNLFYSFLDYDVWTNWVWTQKGLSARQTRDFLNEILKVRHSFAHGHSMPSYPWNTSAGGKIRLTLANLTLCLSFLKFLVRQTDRGVNDHINTRYSIVTSWY